MISICICFPWFLHCIRCSLLLSPFTRRLQEEQESVWMEVVQRRREHNAARVAFREEEYQQKREAAVQKLWELQQEALQKEKFVANVPTCF